MAATIAKARGYDKSGNSTTVTRTGSRAAEGVAATWETEASAYVEADGSGWVQVRDVNGKVWFRYEFAPEADRRPDNIGDASPGEVVVGA